MQSNEFVFWEMMHRNGWVERETLIDITITPKNEYGYITLEEYKTITGFRHPDDPVQDPVPETSQDPTGMGYPVPDMGMW